MSAADSQSQQGGAGPSSLSGLERGDTPPLKAQLHSPSSTINSPRSTSDNPDVGDALSKQVDKKSAWFSGGNDEYSDGGEGSRDGLKRYNDAEDNETNVYAKRRRLNLSESEFDI